MDRGTRRAHEHRGGQRTGGRRLVRPCRTVGDHPEGSAPSVSLDAGGEPRVLWTDSVPVHAAPSRPRGPRHHPAGGQRQRAHAPAARRLRPLPAFRPHALSEACDVRLTVRYISVVRALPVGAPPPSAIPLRPTWPGTAPAPALAADPCAAAGHRPRRNVVRLSRVVRVRVGWRRLGATYSTFCPSSAGRFVVHAEASVSHRPRARVSGRARTRSARPRTAPDVRLIAPSGRILRRTRYTGRVRPRMTGSDGAVARSSTVTVGVPTADAERESRGQHRRRRRAPPAGHALSRCLLFGARTAARHHARANDRAHRASSRTRPRGRDSTCFLQRPTRPLESRHVVAGRVFCTFAIRKPQKHTSVMPVRNGPPKCRRLRRRAGRHRPRFAEAQPLPDHAGVGARGSRRPAQSRSQPRHRAARHRPRSAAASAAAPTRGGAANRLSSPAAGTGRSRTSLRPGRGARPSGRTGRRRARPARCRRAAPRARQTRPRRRPRT